MENKKGNLAEVAQVFFKLGCIAFGGPAAHVAMMEEELITKRKWMSRQHFLDLMGATNLIPGPNSTEMTMHCGHERAGVPGLFVAGICFIFPAVVLTGIFASLYVEYGELPAAAPFIFGIKPAVLAIIASAIYKLSKKALKSRALGILGFIVLVVSLMGVNEILALLLAGVFGTLFFTAKKEWLQSPKSFFPILFLQTGGALTAQITATTIFWTFLKVGAILYGSGYVLFAYLDAELVMNGLLSRQELIDAIAAGQFTPGPVLSTATFIGYQMGGWAGAIAATLGMFLPSFLFVWLLNPLVPKMRTSKPLGFFLDSVNVAALAVMVNVLIEMGRETLFVTASWTPDWRAWTIGLISAFLIFGVKKINAMWIVIGGAVLGYLLMLIG
ncbi:chromate efflux transporter [Aureispira anguillae]|uniref:Chromate efflux transporter n=1 Tax=Aureispira anguillae TaxID=2864201 RepID=A0A915YFI0_9BACT|nr:chromate efflux transporter [Aureispira anguillae]BDS12179.1 chromate efflux transporter [Aureispira anguillae]